MVLRNEVSDRLLGEPREIEPDTTADLVEFVGQIDCPIWHTHILTVDIRISQYGLDPGLLTEEIRNRIGS